MKKLSIFLLIILLFLGCSNKNPPILKYEQNATKLVEKIKPLHVEIDVFESRYFMPWSIGKINLEKEKASWANFVYTKKNKYFAQNLQPWDKKRLKKIISNTNFENYNTVKKYAITTKMSQTRNLPTNKPFFKNPKIGGEGFPFDYMQNTLLHVNTPLFVSHLSSDGAWAFIQSPVSTGWIKTDEFRYIDAKERYKFIQSPKIIITKDNIALYDNNQKYKLHVKLGAIFAKLKEDDEFYYNNDVRIPKKYAKNFPIQYNKENVLQITNELLEEPYGWGGYFEGRDCSAMIKDFFAPFGIWLPRNSALQKDAGINIDLRGLSDKEKEYTIQKYAFPFLSLLYLQGHIMLYVGEEDSKSLVMHNMWGVKTEDKKRIVIGKAVISDLYLGKNQKEVDKNKLLVKRVKTLIIKPNLPPFRLNPFVKSYPSIVDYEDNLLFFSDIDSLEYHDYIKKSFEEKLKNPSIKDMVSLKYPAFKDITLPPKNYDAGRFRNEELFKKLYGENKKEIQNNLVKLEWIDGTTILFNKKQNASIQLQKVINELKTLPKKYKKYLSPIGGTFNFRYIKDTKRLSAHSFGIAIDLNVANSNYWKWDKTYKFQNKIPKEIVYIFEKYGFIWGGRWYHYDTMHFEYRPELFKYGID